jgi:hypothetical protein
MEISSGRLQALPGELSDFQKDILKDGVLTFAEYETAVLSLVDCAQRAGISLAEPVRISKRDTYLYSFTYPLASRAGAEDSILSCRQTYTDYLEQFWAEFTAPSEEELQRARDELARCLRDRGIEVPKPASPEDFGQFRSHPTPDFFECAQQTSDTFGLPGFSG